MLDAKILKMQNTQVPTVFALNTSYQYNCLIFQVNSRKHVFSLFLLIFLWYISLRRSGMDFNFVSKLKKTCFFTVFIDLFMVYLIA